MQLRMQACISNSQSFNTVQTELQHLIVAYGYKVRANPYTIQ